MVAPSGPSAVALALAVLAIRELQRLFSSGAGETAATPEVVETVPAASIGSTLQGWLATARFAAGCVATGCAVGVVIGVWLRHRVAAGPEVRVALASTTSVTVHGRTATVQHDEQPQLGTSRRRRGRGVLEEPPSRPQDARLVRR